MFEEHTEEAVLKRMLNRVPDDLDKREGSIIYTALAPAALEVARMYSDMDRFLGYIFASPDMPEDLLNLKVAEEGLKREEATYAIKKGVFYDQDNNLIDIPIGSRFSINDYNFKAVERISIGEYKMQCESAGTGPNYITGQLIPIEYINSLATAELRELLIPGQDKETNESLYTRYLEHLTEKPFGGNIAYYKMYTKAIDGVGDVKVFPVWAGGGTVKIVFLDSSYNIPTAELIDKVQTEIDPVVNQGKGLGIAPVGHVVTVEGAENVDITINTEILLKAGVTVGQVQEDINETINDYLNLLRKQWSNEDNTIVRISQIEARILNVEGVSDIANTTINSQEKNLVLNENQVPILKEVILNEESTN